MGRPGGGASPSPTGSATEQQRREASRGRVAVEECGRVREAAAPPTIGMKVEGEGGKKKRRATCVLGRREAGAAAPVGVAECVAALGDGWSGSFSRGPRRRRVPIRPFH